MPPDQENPNLLPEQEKLNRQLEALGRYVSGLQQQRQGAKTVAAQPPSRAQPPAAPQPRRPSRGWLLVTGLLVALALAGGVLVGAVAWSDDRPVVAGGGPGASSADQRPETTATWGPYTTTVGPVASVACKTAVDRANTMLATAVALQRELAEYRTIMRDPSNRELSGLEVVEKALPGLGDGARESARLDQALSAYRQVVDQCKLRKP